MAKNSISKKSNKGVQSSGVITVQPKTGSIKGVCGPKDPACGLKVNPVESAMLLTHEQIAERARVLWQSHGCKPGEDELNWHEAETQLKAELSIV
ncbi:MAG: DUF2934 domain-containing protein [Phycisphaerae bacterium]|nr:DUF2934 domain-containing protein [Phycisphaerae bacterium]